MTGIPTPGLAGGGYGQPGIAVHAGEWDGLGLGVQVQFRVAWCCQWRRRGMRMGVARFISGWC